MYFFFYIVRTWRCKIFCNVTVLRVFQVENVTLEIPMPKIVLNCTLTPNQGKYSFDPVSKILLWDIGRIDVTKLPNLRGSVCLL